MDDKAFKREAEMDRSEKKDCEDCQGDGIVFLIPAEGPWACHCPHGEKYRQPIYAPSDKKKEKPLYLKVYRPRKPQLPYKD